jgi:Protein of unknown function (DUF3037)
MRHYFTYSLLQYQYSPALQEFLNVGVVFHFPLESKFYFIVGDLQRIKAVYPSIDRSLILQYVKQIEINVQKSSNLFEPLSEPSHFNKFLHTHLLKRDDTALQFTQSTQVINTFLTSKDAMNAYSKLLLPNTATKEQPLFVRRNEQYVIRNFTQIIATISKKAEQKLKQPQTIRAESGFPLKFDYSWKNGTHNLIKPLSFDVLDENTIIEKTEKFIGIFNIFGKQAKKNNQRLDILITPPQDVKLFGIYEEAFVELSRDYGDSKRLITENEIQKYANETVVYLN